MSEPREQLSSAGSRRREAILADAIRLGRRRRRRRQAARLSVVIAPLIMIVVFAAMFRPQTTITKVSPPSPHPRDTVAAGSSHHDPKNDAIASSRAVRIERIADDPTIVARYATNDAPSAIVRIDDQQLFKELAAANLRGGLATIGGRTRLVLSR